MICFWCQFLFGWGNLSPFIGTELFFISRGLVGSVRVANRPPSASKATQLGKFNCRSEGPPGTVDVQRAPGLVIASMGLFHLLINGILVGL